jgi:hypothetical protein
MNSRPTSSMPLASRLADPCQCLPGSTEDLRRAAGRPSSPAVPPTGEYLGSLPQVPGMSAGPLRQGPRPGGRHDVWIASSAAFARSCASKEVRRLTRSSTRVSTSIATPRALAKVWRRTRARARRASRGSGPAPARPSRSAFHCIGNSSNTFADPTARDPSHTSMSDPTSTCDHWSGNAG